MKMTSQKQPHLLYFLSHTRANLLSILVSFKTEKLLLNFSLIRAKLTGINEGENQLMLINWFLGISQSVLYVLFTCQSL